VTAARANGDVLHSCANDLVAKRRAPHLNGSDTLVAKNAETEREAIL
jgi:hypothetical protein